jgi:branched-chain amino acid aminotransferase
MSTTTLEQKPVVRPAKIRNLANWIGFFNGEYVDESEMVLPIRAKVIQYGLGVFEGVRAYWNADENQLYVFRAAEHFQRIMNSCKIMRLTSEYSVDQLVEVSKEILKANNIKTNTYLRPIFYHGSTKLSPVFEDGDTEFAMYCMPLNDYLDTTKAIHVAISSWNRVPDNCIPARAKPTGIYINSALARDEANKNGFAEAILLSDDGSVSEGSGEHIFLVRNGVLYSPPSTQDNLEGITRLTVIEIATKVLGLKFVEKRINRSELYTADELFFTGTGAEVTPIGSVDRRSVGNGEVGDLTRKIQTAFFDVTYGRNKDYKHWLTPVY